MQLDDMDRYEMRAVMRQCPGLSEEDAELIWETDVCGVRLLDYLRAREGLGSMPERSVDVVITDPPYSPKVHACSRRGASGYRMSDVTSCYR
jgi:hypothetical protein